MNEKYAPKGKTPFERAVDKATYQDATIQFADMAEKGDAEMQQVVLDRVEALIGTRPTSLKEALNSMLEDF